MLWMGTCLINNDTKKKKKTGCGMLHVWDCAYVWACLGVYECETEYGYKIKSVKKCVKMRKRLRIRTSERKHDTI